MSANYINCNQILSLLIKNWKARQRVRARLSPTIHYRALKTET